VRNGVASGEGWRGGREDGGKKEEEESGGWDWVRGRKTGAVGLKVEGLWVRVREGGVLLAV